MPVAIRWPAGPGMLVERAKSFGARRPLIAKALPTAWGFAFGDILTQVMHRDPSLPYSHDFTKTAAMAAVGAAIAAPAGLSLYRWMDAAWPAAALSVSAGKFTLDQIVGCVIWQAAYCSIPHNDAYRRFLLEVLGTASGGAGDGVREAFAYAAAMTSVVLAAPAP